VTAEPESQPEQVPCNGCGRQTYHELLYAQDDDWVEEDHDGHPMLVAKGAKELLKCRGCGGLTMREWQEGSALGGRAETYYPPRVSRRPPPWLNLHRDEEIRGLLAEVYTALHADQRRLAMMGCRAVVDRVLVQAVGDAGGFEEKLGRMVDQHLLSQPHREILFAAIDAGSASAHRGYLPNPEALDHVVSIVEHLAQAELLSVAADEVRKRTPPRPKVR